MTVTAAAIAVAVVAVPTLAIVSMLPAAVALMVAHPVAVHHVVHAMERTVASEGRGAEDDRHNCEA